MKSLHLRGAVYGLCVLLGSVAGYSQQTAVTPSVQPLPAVTTTPVVTTGGKNGLIPVFSDSSTIGQSVIYQYNGGIGIGTVPSALFDVNGTSIYRGILDVARTANATPTAGTGSWPFRFSSQQYNSSAKVTVNTYFQLQAEPTGNNTAATGSTLNLQYFNGGGNPAETGLYFNPNGVIHFAPAQTFPITQGPQGPAGPMGATGPAGPVGPQGPAGTLSFPYFGAATANGNYMLNITNDGDGGGGFFQATTVGDGLTAFGGASNTTQSSSGGAGLTAQGGAGTGVQDFGGAGAKLTGGYSPAGGYQAGDGLDVFGGNGHDANTGGFAIYAVPGANAPIGTYLGGNVQIGGNISKAGGSFRIDHPDDPANKYLSHSFVESPDMMNIYNGNVVTDGSGTAVVTMPTYFESLNRDFRYQLTVMGTQFAQALVAQEIANGSFTIRTDKPNIKVSWQVTGVRQDAWANAHRIPVEEDKTEADKGKYLHPELFGRPDEASIEESHRPNLPRQKKVAPVEVGAR